MDKSRYMALVVVSSGLFDRNWRKRLQMAVGNFRQ
jgi:hypothetical protein